MRILENPSQLTSLDLPRVICAIGVFDGVHLGHQKLIQTVVQDAKMREGTSVIITFREHPYSLLQPSLHIPVLTLPGHKLRLIEKLGANISILMKFTRDVASMTAETWIKDILWGQMRIDTIYLGEDSLFGSDQCGNADTLIFWGKKLGFKVIPLHLLHNEKEAISSTSIRHMINKGALTEAEKYLGRKYSVVGTHTRGRGKGKELGFPTINLNTSNQCLPPNGIYVVQVNPIIDNIPDKPIPAVANLGVSPTFDLDTRSPLLEVHILEQEKIPSAHCLEVAFLKIMRDEKKFRSEKDLSTQIAKDVKEANAYFSLS
jgi:riboflavin kinase/FMN adenylyltransferase